MRLHECIFTPTRVYIYMYMHTYTQTHIYAYTYIRANIHAYMHTHIHIHVHAILYTDKKSQQRRLNASNKSIDLTWARPTLHWWNSLAIVVPMRVLRYQFSCRVMWFRRLFSTAALALQPATVSESHMPASIYFLRCWSAAGFRWWAHASFPSDVQPRAEKMSLDQYGFLSHEYRFSFSVPIR